MEYSRRTFLASASAGTAVALAGCNGDSSDGGSGSDDGDVNGSSGNESSASDPDSGSDPGSADDGPGETTVELGETLSYSEGDEGLAFTVADASLRGAILSDKFASITSWEPEDPENTFLRVEIEVDNTGSEPMTTPAGVVFAANGTEHERTFGVKTDLELTGITENAYEVSKEFAPGESYSGWMVFEVSPDAGAGNVAVSFPNWGDGVTREWTLDLGELEQTPYDYTGNEVGDSITFGTESRQFQFTVVEAQRVDEYDYTSNGIEFTREPEAAEDELLVLTLRAENTGDDPVEVPSQYRLTLYSNGSEITMAPYGGDQVDAYEGGELAPGEQLEGKRVAEVPQSETCTFEVGLTGELTATWPV